MTTRTYFYFLLALILFWVTSCSSNTKISEVVSPCVSGSIKLNKVNTHYGKFSTRKIKIQCLGDGKRVKLLETLIFTDPSGTKWIAPKGHIVDGASIPAPFQPIIGSPFGGEYVMASVIHDVACDEKKRPWRDVHKSFHYAMLASGVAENKALLMYEAVSEGGPRWGKDAEEQLSKKEFKEKILTEKFGPILLDFQIISGRSKRYSGTTLYSKTSLKGKTRVGAITRYNNFFGSAETGDGKPSFRIGWGKEPYNSVSDEERKRRSEKFLQQLKKLSSAKTKK